MKFDFVIGNPPYQDNTLGENDTYAPPVYDKFMDEAYKVGEKVELITPARFLFNAGSTPKAWNQKMLYDNHFKIIHYSAKSSNIFAGTDIKGGVVISYRDNNKDFGSIEVFTPFSELNTFFHKIYQREDFESISDCVVSRTAYRLTNAMHSDFPEALSQLSNGHPFDMSTNIFDRLPQIFFDEKPSDEYVQILGRQNGERTYKWVKRKYINDTINFNKYKVFIAGANGSGALGETLSTPLIGTPLIGNTESFISIGAFDTLIEAENCLKYVKSKFARCLLGVLKITQHITPEKWAYVPLQDFTPDSDIDWSVSVADIDKQLYKKYGLSPEEIEFIETHVKEMV